MIRIVAEIGSVHDGSLGNACKLIEAAASCGADTVKFQTHIPEAESLADAPGPSYFREESRVDYFRRTGFGVDQWRHLQRTCAAADVEFMSSPFSSEAVEILEDVGVDRYKIPSGEVTNIPMLERVAATNKPVLLSSGMSTWAELDRAVEVLRSGGAVTILQCTSAYPCPPERVGLNVIREMQERFGLAVGFSDHSLGSAAAFAAVTLGAALIEKHFTLSRLMYGSDARHSMEPDEFSAFCAGLREIGTMLDHPVDKDDIAALADMKRIFEKSIVTGTAIEKGEVLAREKLAFKKPGDGISAARYEEVVGRTATRALTADHKLQWEDME